MDLVHMMVEMRGKRKKNISLKHVWISGGEKFHFLCLTIQNSKSPPVPNH